MSGPDWRLSSWWGEASPWPELAPLFTGHLHAEGIDEVDANRLLGSMAATQRGRAYLAWHDYQLAAELHDRLVGPEERPEDILVVDGF
ncbi:HNH endonuclease, partial [Gordonia sp. DT101]